jgi:predicted DCC family thiol-disulfide oxidoreductase YuxK
MRNGSVIRHAIYDLVARNRYRSMSTCANTSI